MPGSYALRVGPALLEDGTVVWSPTDRTIAASCAATGQLRWAVEYDANPAFGPLPEEHRSLYAPSSGEVLAVTGNIAMRLGADGSHLQQVSLAEPDLDHRDVRPLGLDETCGLAVHVLDRFEWWDPATLERRSSTRYERRPDWSSGRTPIALPLPDCGFLEYSANDSSRLIRYAPDGSRMWSITPPGPAGMSRYAYPIVALADGGLLLVRRGEVGEPTLFFQVLEPDGSERWSRTHGGEAADLPIPNAFFMSPEGVFYYAVDSGSDLALEYRYVALEIGVGPRLPFMWQHAAQDWARTGSTWAITGT